MGGKKSQKQPSPITKAAPEGKPPVGPAIWESWDAAQNVFYFLRFTKSSRRYKSLDEVLAPILRLSDMRLAITLLILSGAVLSVIALATTFLSMQLANFASDALTQVSGIPQESITLANLGPIVAYQLILYFPVNLIVAIAYEAVAYAIFRSSGGEGTFTQQLYMASVTGLSLALATLLSLASPLPCFQLVAGVALVAATVYILLYVNPKMYVIVHRIGFAHALLVSVLLTIPKLIVLALASDYLAVAMGFPAPVIFPGGA